MDEAHHDASHTGSGSDPDSDLFSALCDLTSFITNSPAVLTIYWELSPDQVSILFSLLLSGAEIESLSLWKELPAGSGAELGEVIKHHGNIRALSLGNGNVENADPLELIRLAAASTSATLEQLAIYRLNLIDTECVFELFDSFGKFPALRSLTIKSCKADVPFIAKRVNSLRALESVHISEFMVQDVNELIANLLSLPVVSDVEILNVEIGAKNHRKIKSLIVSGRITKLRLNGGRLRNGWISAIVNAIRASGRQSCGLQELCLNDNGLGLAGAHAIVELVALSPHLRRLDLKRNLVGKNVLGAVTKCAASLEKLNLDNCMLGQMGTELLLVSPACPALTELAIGGNKLGNLGRKRLPGSFSFLADLH